METPLPFQLPDVSSLAYSPFEWPEYHLAANFPSWTKPEQLPGGVRYGIWPFVIEEYRGDTDPSKRSVALHKRGPITIQVWHRFSRTDIPQGWWQPSKEGALYIGFFSGLDATFLSRWKKRARYYARVWERDFAETTYRIIPVSYEQFAAAYAKSTVAKEIPTYELGRLRARQTLFPEKVFLWGVERLSDRAIVAGLAAFDSPHRGSHYACGFYLSEVHTVPVMVALMYHWFRESLEKQIAVMHLGLFLAPRHTNVKGRPRAISEFKSQFTTDYHTYQPPLTRMRISV